MSVDRGWSIISAPTNLGLRPPEPGATPGTSKAPEALREVGLFDRLIAHGAEDSGVVLPARYLDDADPRNERVRNHTTLLEHADRLADRIDVEIARGRRPIVIGGDCSVLVGVGLALRRGSPAGLVHIDGHTDYRNPRNSDACGALAGEDLAAVTGKHWASLSDHGGLGPYFLPENAVQVGCRDDDDDLVEVSRDLRLVVRASEIVDAGAPAAVEAITAALAHTAGWWLHVDVDVLDPQIMPAVDSPDAGGLTAEQLGDLLRGLVPGCIGVDICVYDPDLDPDLRYAKLIARIVEGALID